MTDHFLSLAEAAKMLKSDPETLWNALGTERTRLPFRYVNPNQHLLPKSHVDRLKEKLQPNA